MPDGAASAAILWGAAHRCALNFPAAVKRAVFDGDGLEPGEKLFDAIISSPSGVTFTADEWDDVWSRVHTAARTSDLIAASRSQNLVAKRTLSVRIATIP